ncbi:RAMP superfamily CRISPR-associated protein [Anaerocellum danielii]|uniref:RAMP superfamily CRISPR-associated protein n=1 Tax=Anaerocellum danielii TaxID=1387557 RepID=A0ABZ0U3X5_9FIRM|nr:RAMP superfamily CRISPR-associated protein [Caldicellulosiruptor danielii]WPX08970.1 RAMP superfamily CRISPR-associated protein [Caldicellulosiruptor danielii]
MLDEKREFKNSNHEFYSTIFENEEKENIIIYKIVNKEKFFGFNKLDFENKYFRKVEISNKPLQFELSKQIEINIKRASCLENLQQIKLLVPSSIPYTIAMQTRIRLKAPYHSRDEDEFYVINNPILKEKVIKLPMIRGSAIKGGLEKAALKVIEEEIQKDLNNSQYNEALDTFKKYTLKLFRIFGCGNDELREFKSFVEKMINKPLSENKDDIRRKFIEYLLNNFGGYIATEIGAKCPDINNLTENLINLFANKNNEGIKIQKGRLSCYPVFFSKIDFEVINPHSRKTRSGTNPIFFEVVPAGEENILTLIYTPFDAVFNKSKNEIKKEAIEDLNFLIVSLEKFSEMGIGAKKKYGWGRFELISGEKKIYIRKYDEEIMDNILNKDWEVIPLS